MILLVSFVVALNTLVTCGFPRVHDTCRPGQGQWLLWTEPGASMCSKSIYHIYQMNKQKE